MHALLKSCMHSICYIWLRFFNWVLETAKWFQLNWFDVIERLSFVLQDSIIQHFEINADKVNRSLENTVVTAYCVFICFENIFFLFCSFAHFSFCESEKYFIIFYNILWIHYKTRFLRKKDLFWYDRRSNDVALIIKHFHLH